MKDILAMAEIYQMENQIPSNLNPYLLLAGEDPPVYDNNHSVFWYHPYFGVDVWKGSTGLKLVSLEYG